MVKIVFQRNCVYQTAYHAVWCPKYRKPVLVCNIATETERLIREICIQRQWDVLALEIQPDHIHLFVSLPPSISVAEVMKILKGSIARTLFVKFPELIYGSLPFVNGLNFKIQTG